jgi:hypothetical protein
LPVQISTSNYVIVCPRLPIKHKYDLKASFHIHVFLKANSLEQMSACLRGRYEVAVWSLLKRTANVKNMIGLIIPSADDIALHNAQIKKEKDAQLSHDRLSNDAHHIQDDETSANEKSSNEAGLASADEVSKIEECHFEVVFRTREVISSFAINPLDKSTFVLATPQSVVEIDVETAKIFAERRTSVSENHRQSRDDLSVPCTTKDLSALFFTDPIDSSSEKEKEKIPRNLSFDSLQRAVKKSMATLRQPDVPKSELDSGQRIHRSLVGVTALEAHPTLNYCKIFHSVM